MTYGISILLSYYNGRKYFKEQFLSVIVQMEETDELIIRDDGSIPCLFLESIITEDTLARELFDRNQIKLLTGINLGVNASFFTLLQHARNPVSVFCDQDDKWVKGRLTSVRENYGSDLHCVNYSVDGISQLHAPVQRGSFRALLRNFVPGCCMSGRTEYLKKLALHIPNSVIYDHALLYISLATKHNVTYDTKTLVNYRRHVDTVTKYNSFAPNGIWSSIQLRFQLVKLKRWITKI